MKKLSILLLSAVALGSTFVSCSKEEDNNLSMSGKWNFSKLNMTDPSQNQTVDFTSGWKSDKTQCVGLPDYIDFSSAANIEYGDNDNESGDCTLSKSLMSYSTSTTTVTFKDPANPGNDGVFTVTKKTSTELQLQMVNQGITYTFILVKAS